MPWSKIDIKVIGIETAHAGIESKGSEEEIIRYMKNVGYARSKKLGDDTIFIKNEKRI